MIYSVNVRIEVPVRNIEVTDHVGDAVGNIFLGVEFDHRPGQLADEAHELECFSERLHEQTILDIVRREFIKYRDDDGFPFALKRQAVSKGVVNFSVDNPDELGGIEAHVIVRDPSVDEVINYIASPTEEGWLVDPNDR